eukprot:gb/GECG01005709.1/.p1 GENE.gb/GECG01005709.1/~~gb/GECG01005709.1/.p1  ORF type:complete len:234 (+),score=13.90 gb/GECG01005709.1/:1-702(+)
MKMGRPSCAIVGLLCCMILPTYTAVEAGRSNKHQQFRQRQQEVCINSGKPPVKRAKSLGPCAKFEHRTCCNSTAATPTDVLKKVSAVVEADGLSESCRSYFLDAACMTCDPAIGTGASAGVCDSFCRQWYDACKDDFFIRDDAIGLKPCSSHDIICGKLDTISSGPDDFCSNWMGQTISKSRSCYDGSPPKGSGIQEPRSVATHSLSSANNIFIVTVCVFIVLLFREQQWSYT